MVNNVSFAAHSGCMNRNGTDYRDAAMFTQSGYKCLFWEDVASQSVNPQTYPNSGKTFIITVGIYETMQQFND